MRIEEEERLIEEEERKKEEVKARKKEKERLKKEELKKAGKYLTPKQKEAARLAELRLQQMKEAGMIVVGLGGQDGGKKTGFDKKKKKGGKEAKAPTEEELKAVETKKEEERLAAEAKAKAEEEAKKVEEEAGMFFSTRWSRSVRTTNIPSCGKSQRQRCPRQLGRGPRRGRQRQRVLGPRDRGRSGRKCH